MMSLLENYNVRPYEQQVHVPLNIKMAFYALVEWQFRQINSALICLLYIG